MFNLFSSKFKLFLLINTPIWVMLTINGWLFVPIIVLGAWFFGGFIDGIKEDPIEYALEDKWSSIWLKLKYVQFHYKGETYRSSKRYDELCQDTNDINYDIEYQTMRAFRKWQYDEVRAPIFKHKNLWWSRVHLVYLMSVICIVHFFKLPTEYIFYLEASFLQCEIGYYIYTIIFHKRFFPKSYNLWGILTEKRLYLVLTFINLVYLILSFFV